MQSFDSRRWCWDENPAKDYPYSARSIAKKVTKTFQVLCPAKSGKWILGGILTAIILSLRRIQVMCARQQHYSQPWRQLHSWWLREFDLYFELLTRRSSRRGSDAKHQMISAGTEGRQVVIRDLGGRYNLRDATNTATSSFIICCSRT